MFIKKWAAARPLKDYLGNAKMTRAELNAKMKKLHVEDYIFDTETGVEYTIYRDSEGNLWRHVDNWSE